MQIKYHRDANHGYVMQIKYQRDANQIRDLVDLGPNQPEMTNFA